MAKKAPTTIAQVAEQPETVIIRAPEFKYATDLEAVIRKEAEAASSLRTIMNAYVDECHAADLPRDEIGCEAMRLEFMSAMGDFLAEYPLEKRTLANYVRGMMRAFYHGMEWSPSAFLPGRPGTIPPLPWSVKAGEKKTPKAKPGAQHKAAKAETTTTGADTITGPNDALEARKFIRGQLNTLVAYGNKHMGKLDLTTRDVLAQLAKLAQTIDKIDAAPL